MSSSMGWAADSIGQSIGRARDQAHSNEQLAIAEKWHRGTLAQLTAALGVLEKLAPNHSIHHPIVLHWIKEAGEKSRTFQEAASINREADQILECIRVDYELARAAALNEIRELEVLCISSFWSGKDFFKLGQRKFPTEAEAVDFKDKLLRLVQRSALGSPLKLEYLAGKLDS